MSENTRASGCAGQRWLDYLDMCKPRVVAEMLFTALIGMLVAEPAVARFPLVVFALAGIALVAGASATINHIADRHIDALMDRTAERPLARGRVPVAHSIGFALLLASLGTGLLVWFTNPLTVALTLATLVGYSFVYTSFLKYATPQNIVLGGLAGAMPPLLGWTAVTGEVHPVALLLVLIIFTWTPPHFWALAIERRDEYARAGVPMLPVTHGVAHTRLQILVYAVALVAVSLGPWLVGFSATLYLVAALLLGGRFVQLAWRLYRDRDPPATLFRFSIVYLTGLFAALLADRWL